jgi:ATP-dependent Clp protease protease subunit
MLKVPLLQHKRSNLGMVRINTFVGRKFHNQLIKGNKMSTQKDKEQPRVFYSFEDAGYYMLSGEITEENTTDCIKYIIERNFNLADCAKQTEIKLIINSVGGDLTSAHALIDVIKGSRIPVSTFGLGCVASAGLAIFISGQKGLRFLTCNTSILSHQYSWGAMGKEHELYARNKEFELTTARVLAHYRKCTGLPEKKIKELLLPPHDVWLTAEEAVEYKLADKIIDFYM